MITALPVLDEEAQPESKEGTKEVGAKVRSICALPIFSKPGFERVVGRIIHEEIETAKLPKTLLNHLRQKGSSPTSPVIT